MPEALAAVKRELGNDAVILGTRSTPATGLGRMVGLNQVEITAAPPGTPESAPQTAGSPAKSSPAAKLSTDDQPYYTELIQNEVAADLAAHLVQRAKRKAVRTTPGDSAALRDTVREYIAGMIPTSDGISLAGDLPRRVALVGPAGSGKTTTLAKLAAHFRLRQRRNVAILSLDMQRMAAHTQLRRYAEIIDVPMLAAHSPAELEAHLGALNEVDLALIDTPGIGLQDRERLTRLTTLLRAAHAHEVHLVVSACLSAAVQARAARVFEPLGVTHVVLTRLDDAVGLGTILSLLERLKWELSYVSSGQKVPNDIELACSQRVAELILPRGYVAV